MAGRTARWYVPPVGRAPHDELIEAAASVLNPHEVGGRLFADVGAALVTANGNRYLGVCIDTTSGTGFCAEQSAIATMVGAGEHRIAQIVAVWRDDEDGLYVIPPFGRCREFIHQVDDGNLDAEVVLGRRESSLLRELLPRNEWPDRLS